MCIGDNPVWAAGGAALAASLAAQLPALARLNHDPVNRTSSSCCAAQRHSADTAAAAAALAAHPLTCYDDACRAQVCEKRALDRRSAPDAALEALAVQQLQVHATAGTAHMQHVWCASDEHRTLRADARRHAAAGRIGRWHRAQRRRRRLRGAAARVQALWRGVRTRTRLDAARWTDADADAYGEVALELAPDVDTTECARIGEIFRAYSGGAAGAGAGGGGGSAECLLEQVRQGSAVNAAMPPERRQHRAGGSTPGTPTTPVSASSSSASTATPQAPTPPAAASAPRSGSDGVRLGGSGGGGGDGDGSALTEERMAWEAGSQKRQRKFRQMRQQRRQQDALRRGSVEGYETLEGKKETISREIERRATLARCAHDTEVQRRDDAKRAQQEMELELESMSSSTVTAGGGGGGDARGLPMKRWSHPLPPLSKSTSSLSSRRG